MVSLIIKCVAVFSIGGSQSHYLAGVVFDFEALYLENGVLWNRLPASIVLAENIHLFKKPLRQVYFSYAMFGKD